MPDKPLTIATYAAGASLAAITLIYVFGPTFFIDGDSSNSSGSSRKKGVVGLINTANDCFINSVLQSLAGLGELRIYLIRETHRRRLEPSVYQYIAEAEEKAGKAWKLEGLQQGIVTHALKEVLDGLNERPIYKKTMSAGPFVIALEQAFRQRISRQQQDAQEFLQIVAERLCEEYHAGRKARQKARQRMRLPEQAGGSEQIKVVIHEDERATAEVKGIEVKPTDALGLEVDERRQNGDIELSNDEVEDSQLDDGFPFEGQLESQIECMTCRFKPRPSVSSFVSLTLNVPPKASTLNDCFDGLFKTEHIDEFKCDKCRLVHAVHVRLEEAEKARSEKDRQAIESDIARIEAAIAEDPEKPPEGVVLPDSKFAPKRRIGKHVRITAFPKIMAVHLSRSIFDPMSTTFKNTAKVAFPERLPLGGILDQKKYKLLGVVTHKGSHHSGHYESFRRQNVYPPFSTPNAFNPNGAFSPLPSPNLSHAPSPRLSPSKPHKDYSDSPPPSPDPGSLLSPAASTLSTPSSPTPSPSDSSTRLSFSSGTGRPGSRNNNSIPTSAPRDLADTASQKSKTLGTRSSLNIPSPAVSKAIDRAASITDAARFTSRKKPNDRWWRISDEKIKECRTSEVLSMQKEVYLLFYELERESEALAPVPAPASSQRNLPPLSGILGVGGHL